MSQIKKIISDGAHEPSIVTRELGDLQGPAGNVYKAISIISKRSVQLSRDMKEELTSKLSEFQDPIELTDDIMDNKEQQELSKYYERMPSPNILAIEEYLQSETHWEEIAKTEE